MSCVAALVLAMAGATVGPAVPSPIAISPTTLEIPPGRHSAVLEVVNEGEEPVDLQLRAYRWSEPDGQERLDPAADVLVSPAITTIAPHARQLFRVLRRGEADPQHESAYRLRLNQLPSGSADAVGISFEFLLPLFAGGTAAEPVLSWTTQDGVLQLRNTGGRRIKLSDATLMLADGGAVPVGAAQGGYVLAGEAARWNLPARTGSGATPVRLLGRAGSGTIDVPRAVSVASR